MLQVPVSVPLTVAVPLADTKPMIAAVPPPQQQQN